MGNAAFAQGLCYYKIFCIFVIGAIIGDIVETIFCYFKYRKWMCRSSFIYGHMSAVWGGAFSIATILSYYIGEWNLVSIFMLGIIFGGIYEYICSVFTEISMGVKFWDYSKMPYNVGGRINLKYCLYWGIATSVWIKFVCPVVEAGIEKMPIKQGTILCNVASILVAIDALLSAMAIRRYIERRKGYFPNNCIWKYFDCAYPDERIEKIYPDISICGNANRTHADA